jgi:glycosyltransferase involved in cell wall biosynthesis
MSDQSMSISNIERVTPSVEMSVVIPTYGRPGAVERCLDALALQKGECLGRFEVIVVDDGSPVPVQLDPHRWAERFTLRVIRQKNSGPAAARNRGAEAASGEFLAFTDDDCLPCPGWLDSLAEALNATPDALVGTATWNGIPENLFSAASQLIIDIVYDHNNQHPDDAHFLASNNFACARSHFLEMRGFDESFPRPGAEDRDFCDRWRISGRAMRFLRKPYVEHRHAQTLEKYLDLHFRYGRGAYLYQIKGNERGVFLPMHPGFYENLVPTTLTHLAPMEDPPRQAGLALALLLWQVANTAGYFTEWFYVLRNRSK